MKLLVIGTPGVIRRKGAISLSMKETVWSVTNRFQSSWWPMMLRSPSSWGEAIWLQSV